MARTSEEKKVAATERMRRWRAANPEKVRAKAKERRETHPHEHREQEQRRRQKDPEAHRAKKRAKYAEQREAILARSKAWRDANPEKVKALHCLRKYGITLEQWKSLFEAQGKVCARCGVAEPGSRYGWATDHCHVTGRVRGILCQRCNTLIGQQGDTAEAVIASHELTMAYLRRKA